MEHTGNAVGSVHHAAYFRCLGAVLSVDADYLMAFGREKSNEGFSDEAPAAGNNVFTHIFRSF